MGQNTSPRPRTSTRHQSRTGASRGQHETSEPTVTHTVAVLHSVPIGKADDALCRCDPFLQLHDLEATLPLVLALFRGLFQLVFVWFHGEPPLIESTGNKPQPGRSTPPRPRLEPVWVAPCGVSHAGLGALPADFAYVVSIVVLAA